MVNGMIQDGENGTEGWVTCIAADLYGCAQQADGPQLLEYIGVAKQGTFHGSWFVLWLMMADRLCDPVEFFRGKSPCPEEFPALLDGVWDVIPAGKLLWILRTVAKKHTKVMHPGGGEENVVVVLHAFTDVGGEGVEPGLVAEFVDGACFRADVRDD
jgi:hypothetical protein